MKDSKSLCEKLKITTPIFCGAMYPCSNPELIASVSDAGGMGIVQPLSLTYVWGHDFRNGLKKIKSLTSRPFGMNVLLEKSSRTYENRMQKWVDIALEEGCRFFVSALGNPKDLVKQVHASGGLVFHDVTERKWALKAIEAHVDGLIAVNRRAGGHAGTKSPEEILNELKDLNLPVICAGGVGDAKQFKQMLDLGYAGVQMGTRFIATTECSAHDDYKQAILRAEEKDIVLTERVTGIPLSVIRTPYVDQVGTKAGALAKFFLQHRQTKEWMRLWYNLRALIQMKRSVRKGFSTKDYWQAGRSVAGIHQIQSAREVVKEFGAEIS